MKKLIVVSSLVAMASLGSLSVQAEATKEENIGVASGALVGAAAGGPVGFIIGAAVGAIIGDNVNKTEELENKEKQLIVAQQKEQDLQKELSISHTKIVEQSNTQKWLSEAIRFNLMFTTNSSELSDKDKLNIQDIAFIMQKFPNLHLKLEGYADPRGTKDDNLRLSSERIDAVIAEFESQGIESDRLTGQAHGELSQSPNSFDLDKYAMSRRVSISLFESQSDEVFAENSEDESSQLKSKLSLVDNTPAELKK